MDWPHHHLPVVGSTNAVALERAAQADGPFWLTADRQVSGRGRRGRAWHSPPGNLHATALIFATGKARPADGLPLVMAVATHEAMCAARPELADRLAIKWPNDLLLDGSKVAGLLIEVKEVGGRRALACGFGVNCHVAPPDLDAIGLAQLGIDLGPEELLTALARTFAGELAIWDEGRGLARTRDRWLARAAGVGGPLTVRLPDRETAGTFECMDRAGRLILLRDDGTREAIAAGDVFFGRPEHGSVGPNTRKSPDE